MGWSRTLTIDLGLGTGKFKADPDPWSTAFGKGAQAGTRTIVRTHTHDIAAALQGKTEYHKMRTRGFKVLDKVIPFAGDALRPSALAGAFFVCDSPLNRYSCRAQAPNGVGCGVPCTRVLVFSRKSRKLSDGILQGHTSRWLLPLSHTTSKAEQYIIIMADARIAASACLPSVKWGSPVCYMLLTHLSISMSAALFFLFPLFDVAGTEFVLESEWAEVDDPHVDNPPDTQKWYYNGHFHPDDWTGTYKKLKHHVRRRLWARHVRPYTKAESEESRPASSSSAAPLSPVSPGSGMKEKWMHDDDVDVCSRCLTTKFSFTIRKHHCRFCGWVICNDCSKRKQYVSSLGQDLFRFTRIVGIHSCAASPVAVTVAVAV